MWASLQAPLLFGLIAAGCTMIGLLAVAVRADWSQKHADLFGLAAAGMLTSIALLHLVPESFEFSENAAAFLTAGFFVGLVVNFTVRTLFPEQGETAARRDAFTPIIAIAIHSFIDGIVYAVTFAASFEAGALAALSLSLHELPEGVIAFAILRRSGFSKWSSLGWAFLAASLTTPLGVLASGPFLEFADETLIGALFALSGGLLLFVATGPLMSPLRDEPAVRGIGAVGTGVLIAVCLTMLPFFGHDHGKHGMDAEAHDHGHEARHFSEEPHGHDHGD